MLGRPALLALIALPAFAQTVYSWVDKNGTTHFTDDPSLVPGKGNVDATLLNAKQKKPEPQEDAQVVMDAKPAAQPQPQTVPAQQVVTQKQPPLVAQPTRNDDIERQWRERFIGANRRIETLQQSYVALEKSRPQRVECGGQTYATTNTVIDPQTGAPVVPPGTVYAGNTMLTRPYAVLPNCSVNAEYDRITGEMELTKVQLSDAKKDLEQLDRDASNYAIPREWRRGW